MPNLCGFFAASRTAADLHGDRASRSAAESRGWAERLSRQATRLVALALLAPPAFAAAQGIPFSQRAAVMQRVGYTDITIEYSRPVARGRTLFGRSGVVRPGRIWTPGADSATLLTVSRDVTVEGHPLAAGSYTLWLMVADSGQPWTLIVSRAAHVFHVPYPGSALDVLRAPVVPVEGDPMDALAWYFPVVAPDSAVLRMQWGTTTIPIRIRTK